MTPLDLIKALASDIRLAVSDYRLMADEDGLRPVSVIEGYVPQGYFEREEGREQPLVSVMIDEVEDAFEVEGVETMASVSLVMSVYNESPDGWIDLMNLTETVRRHLLIHRLIDRKYRLVLPMSTVWPERQTAMPFWYSEIDVRYWLPQPQELPLKTLKKRRDLTAELVNKRKPL